MSEQTINQIIPPVGVSNETLIGELSSYFRWNEESRNYEMLERIDPGISMESWAECPSPVYDRLANPNRRPTVGEIIRSLNNQSLREQRIQRQYDEFRQKAFDTVRLIGEALIAEADDRQYCEEFDRFMDNLNEMIPAPFELPTRKKPRRLVSVSISATVTAYADVWVDDDCDDEDDPDNWYSEQEDEYPLGSDWAGERLQKEINYNGFDDWECSAS